MTSLNVAYLTETKAVMWLRERRRLVQALLVGGEGSAPLAPGAMMLIGERG